MYVVILCSKKKKVIYYSVIAYFIPNKTFAWLVLRLFVKGNAFGDDNLQMPKGTTKHYLNLVWLSKCWKEIPFEVFTCILSNYD